jgi:FMN-dependent NADH-azoreductase
MAAPVLRRPSPGDEPVGLEFVQQCDQVGGAPRFITAELTMAAVNPAMADLKPPADDSLSLALRQIDELWRVGVTVG